VSHHIVAAVFPPVIAVTGFDYGILRRRCTSRSLVDWEKLAANLARFRILRIVLRLGLLRVSAVGRRTL
jgi:hypothetical protein